MLFLFQKDGPQIPFTATIKDEKLYGRGSCDMKGFIACTLAFAPVFKENQFR